LAAVFLITACNPKSEDTNQVNESQTAEDQEKEEIKEEEKQEEQEEQKEEDKDISKDEKEDSSETRIFVDSLGREVEIPKTIERIAPSGHMAQMIIYSLDPDILIGWGRLPGKAAQKYIDEKYLSLPEFGAFYGKKADLNVEALIEANPQLIVDLGQIKGENMKEDLDGLQEKTGVPVIFIEAELPILKQTYQMLGDLIGQQEKADKLGNYCVNIMEEAKENSSKIADEDKIRVYYGEGDNGLQTNPPQSIHAEVINLVGGINVADLPETSGAGLNEITIEQILNWQPEFIIFGPNSVYDSVAEDPLWSDISAIKDDNYYEVPMGPYNWMGRPPAVNRVLGIKWLGNLLYPEVFDYDMKEVTKEFYSLFYHYDLTDAEVDELLMNSTLKKAE
ncbi:MAG: ABC transporter substrate-binding protein, partial [Tissierellia bacterium]|nr:ABC transporter substrate-binding protein [Tissierellia bacterium]